MEIIKQKLTSTRYNLEQFKKDGRIDKLAYQILKKSNDESINFTDSCTKLPTSTQLISDCKKRFKELEGKGNIDFRSYMNGYLDSFSKNVVSKMK